MANDMSGEMATCACGAQGWIINRSHPLNPSKWWEIHHENDVPHFVTTRRRPDGAMRFVLLDESDWRP